MTLLTRATLFFIAASLSFLSASIFLVHQYKQGIPYSFVVNMILAAAVGLVVPVLATSGYAMLKKETSALSRFFVYFAVCILLIAALGAITF